MLDGRQCYNRFMRSHTCLDDSAEGTSKVTLQARKQEFVRDAIWTAAIDDSINAEGYILPGLGDVGDRMFGTR